MNTSGTTKTKNTILGLQNEGAVEQVQRESGVPQYKGIILKLEVKQMGTNRGIAEFKALLQSTLDKIQKMTGTMSFIVERIEGFRAKPEDLGSFGAERILEISFVYCPTTAAITSFGL